MMDRILSWLYFNIFGRLLYFEPKWSKKLHHETRDGKITWINVGPFQCRSMTQPERDNLRNYYKKRKERR